MDIVRTWALEHLRHTCIAHRQSRPASIDGSGAVTRTRQSRRKLTRARRALDGVAPTALDLR